MKQLSAEYSEIEFIKSNKPNTSKSALLKTV